MDSFWNGFEKQAGVIGKLWGKIPAVKANRAIEASPLFKAKRVAGMGLLAGGGAIYGAHKLTQDPPLANAVQPTAYQQQY
jgi:hypothetical protein